MRPDPDVIGRRIRGTLLLIHLRTDRIVELNGTAARVWELLASGCPVAEMPSVLEGEYDASPGRLGPEVNSALNLFQTHGLVSA